MLRTGIKIPGVADLGPSKLISCPDGLIPQAMVLRSQEVARSLSGGYLHIFDQMTSDDYQDAVMFAHAGSFLLRCGESRLRKLYNCTIISERASATQTFCQN